MGTGAVLVLQVGKLRVGERRCPRPTCRTLRSAYTPALRAWSFSLALLLCSLILCLASAAAVVALHSSSVTALPALFFSSLHLAVLSSCFFQSHLASLLALALFFFFHLNSPQPLLWPFIGIEEEEEDETTQQFNTTPHTSQES